MKCYDFEKLNNLVKTLIRILYIAKCKASTYNLVATIARANEERKQTKTRFNNLTSNF